MKKLYLLCAAYCALCIGTTFGYTSDDLSNAQYLAERGVIVQRNLETEYRLDDMVLRQEVIGMALKLQGVTLPENYTCKKYFTDAIQNDWVCRAVELAADNGIITRANARVRPADRITRAEALAILLKTGKITLSQPRRVIQPDGTVWSLFQDLRSLGFTQWQADMLDSLPSCEIINHGDSCEDGAAMNKVFASFQPNAQALRATVFEFASLMLGFHTGDDIGSIFDDLNILTDTRIPETYKEFHLSPEALKTLLQNEPLQVTSKTPKVALVVFSDFECPFCVRYFENVIGPLMKDTTQNLALVYKHFPLSFHEHAYQWALESECVGAHLENTDFFRYVYKRYSDQSSSLSTLVPDLTSAQIKSCATDEILAQNIASDQKLGELYSVTGTPTTLVINIQTGYYEPIVGAYDKEHVENVIKTVQEHL